MKTVNGTIVKGTVALTAATTSGTIAHGLGMVTNVNLTLGSATTSASFYYTNTLPVSADIIIVCTSGATLSYAIAGY